MKAKLILQQVPANKVSQIHELLMLPEFSTSTDITTYGDGTTREGPVEFITIVRSQMESTRQEYEVELEINFMIEDRKTLDFHLLGQAALYSIIKTVNSSFLPPSNSVG